MAEKILMLLDHPFPDDGRVYNEARSLIQSGREVHLCVPEFKHRNAYETMDHIIIHRFSVPQILFKWIQATSARFPIYHYFWIYQIVKINIRFSYIHVHDLPLSKTGLMISRKWKVPWILDLHENYPALLKDSGNIRGIIKKYFFNIACWKKYEKWAVSRADRIIAVVEESKNRLKKYRAPNKIYIISNTQPLSMFHPSEKEKKNSSFRVLYVGGIGPHRGLEVVVHAMPEILQTLPQAEFNIVGAGRGEENIKRLITQLHLKQSVKLIGWKPLHELSHYIQNADICIVPHLATEHTNSTVPHKLFQYMAMAKPVLVSDCLPLKRIVSETHSGLVFRTGDVGDFTEKILQLNDVTRRHRMGLNGYQAVMKKYHWEHEAKNLTSLYHALDEEYLNV